jgi:putative transposase
MTVIRHRRPARKLRLGPHDRITLAGSPYCRPQRTETGWAFRRDDMPELGVSLTHEQIDELVKQPGYGYQRDHYDPVALARRAKSAAASMDDVRMEERPRAHFKHQVCQRMERLHREGRIAFSGGDTERGLAIVGQEILQLECAKVQPTTGASAKRRKSRVDLDRGVDGSARRGGRRVGVTASGDPGAGLRKMPGAPTFWKWWAKYKRGGGTVWGMRDEYQNCGAAPAPIGQEAAAVLDEMGRKRSSLGGASKEQLLVDMRVAIDALNADRGEEDRIPCPSRRQLNDFLDGLSDIRVVAGRDGIARARKSKTIASQGVGAVQPLQRVEMDHWTVNLMNILVAVGLWAKLNRQQRRRIARMHLCVAIDCATKVILGMHLSETPTTADALAVLRMMVSDKQPFADAVGALLPWDMAGSGECIATDGGAVFTSDQFGLAVAGLGSTHLIPPGGLPQLRGTIERFFRTVHTRLIARFRGRTFENMLARGDYPAKALANLDTLELAWVIVRWVVDVYHATPHEGLGRATPRNAWLQAVELYDVTAPPDPNTLRSVFGIPLVRTLGNEGIRILGLRYWSEELVRHFLDRGKQEIEVKLDPHDVGEISVRIGKAWHVARCVRREVHGVSLRTWVEAASEMRRVNVHAAALTEPIVLEAIRSIEAVSAGAQMREGIADPTPTTAQINHLDRSVLYGFRLPDPVQAAATPEDPLSGGAPVTGVRSDGLLPDAPPNPTEPPIPPGKTVELPTPATDAPNADPTIDDDFDFED